MDQLRRLIDQENFSSPEEAQLRDLVQASSATDLSRETRQTVYGSVVRRQVKGRARLSMFRPAVVFAVLLVAAGATTAATLGQRWIADRNRPSQGPPAAPLSGPPERPALRPDKAIVAPRPTALSVPEPPNPGRRPSRTARARSEDPSEVVLAVDALRNQRDPDRAATLLARYLAAHPSGALVEEAVALSIEAAAARHDPAAAEFARRYLRDYPNGRFRQTAAAALRGTN